MTPKRTLDLVASFQHAVIHELLTRAAASAEQIGARSLIVSGGVACNSGLRSAAYASGLPYPVHFPSVGLSTDNAAMIAAAAFPKLARGEFAALDIGAQANLSPGLMFLIRRSPHHGSEGTSDGAFVWAILMLSMTLPFSDGSLDRPGLALALTLRAPP